MNATAELVLVVSDMNVPFKVNDIPAQFKTLLIPNKIQHVLCLGNMGSKESYDWLKSLSNNFQAVKGEFDEDSNLQETKVITIGEFKIGMIHGHQICPSGDLDSLSTIQKQLNCDILLSGHTSNHNVSVVDGKYYINPGSISGCFSQDNPAPVPSFILMVIQGDFAIVYLYELTDEEKKFEVTKMEFTKNSNELININEKDDEAEENEDENENEN